MDTSAVAVRADALGRRLVPRHFRSLADKLSMIAEVRQAGARGGGGAPARNERQPFVRVDAPTGTGSTGGTDSPITAEAAGRDGGRGGGTCGR